MRWWFCLSHGVNKEKIVIWQFMPQVSKTCPERSRMDHQFLSPFPHVDKKFHFFLKIILTCALPCAIDYSQWSKGGPKKWNNDWRLTFGSEELRYWRDCLNVESRHEMYRILIPELNRSLSGQVSKIAQVLFMELDGKSRFTNAVVASGVR